MTMGVIANFRRSWIPWKPKYAAHSPSVCQFLRIYDLGSVEYPDSRIVPFSFFFLTVFCFFAEEPGVAAIVLGLLLEVEEPVVTQGFLLEDGEQSVVPVLKLVVFGTAAAPPFSVGVGAPTVGFFPAIPAVPSV
jgi:hypothetical protein